MSRKIVILVVFGICLLGCESDFEQGKCDEGYFEQDNGQGTGGSYCVPISGEDGLEKTINDNKNLNKVD